MGTYDPIMVDNKYPGDFDNEKYLFSKQEQQQQISNEDGGGSFGRRVYLESPSFGNKEEEDMYRYVPSRVTDRTSSIVGNTLSGALPGTTLMDSLDFDLDLLTANNPRSDILSKPVVPTRQLSNMPRTNPRQDPLLGPLLAELDAMSNQQQLPPSSPPIYQRNSLPYESNLVRPLGSSPSNHVLTNVANRTVNDALLDPQLYDSLDPKNQQRHQINPLQTVNSNSLNYSRPLNMDGTDVFVPSSYRTEPGPFLSHFGPEDQLFQRPLLNTLGQNYVPNLKLPQQRDTAYDQTYNHISPRQRTTNAPPTLSNPFIEYKKSTPQTNPSYHQDLFFTDHNANQLERQQQQQQQQQDQDSKRQAVWNELQRTNVKVQEKNAKKPESTNRIKAPFGSSSYNQQLSPVSKPSQRSFPQPPPVPKSNYIEDNIDMIKNKENFYHRYPGRKYENLYSKRKDLEGGIGNDRQEQDSSLPAIGHIKSRENSQSGSLPATVTIPLDSRVNRDGDKISVNIDLRLVDLEHLGQQQQNNAPPNWSSGDPLDRHIRKLERNIDHSLPTKNPPQRTPVIATTSVNTSAGRYGKPPTGTGRSGYTPPIYGGNYNYSDKGQEENSYLARLNQTRSRPQFKPYTGRDYEQFKKNYGFGTGHLGFDFDNTTHKEKSEKLAKTRQYAQQIEAMNKKKISEMNRRTLSDTRLQKGSRPFEYPPSAIRPKVLSGKTNYSSPAILNEPIMAFIPARRPTEVLYRPAPVQRQLTKLPSQETNEIVEQDKPSIIKNIEQDKSSIIKNTLNPSPKRREVSLVQDRHNQRRLVPLTKLPQLPTTGNTKRRPLRFDDELTRPLQQQQSNVNQDNIENMVIKVIRQELNQKPLNPNEELVIVEK